MLLKPLKTEDRYIPSTASERFEPKSKRLVIIRRGFFAPVSIPDFNELGQFYEASITSLPQRLIRELEKLYIFDDPKEIRSFLLTNDYLLEILSDAPYHIYRIFGQIPIHLELHNDPEEGWDELFIVIKSPYSAKEAIELEEKLVKEWFLDRLKDTKGKLNITEEPL